MDYGKDFGYANERLAGSYIQLDNNFFLVDHVNGSGKVEGTPLGGGYRDGVPLSKFVLETPKLGFFNVKGGSKTHVQYLSRLPARHYRQGLRRQNSVLKELGGVGQAPWNLNEGASQILTGNYPSLEVVLDTIFNEEGESSALSLDFAIGKHKKNLALFYKNLPVGKILSDNGDVTLNRKYLFLKEALEDVVGK